MRNVLGQWLCNSCISGYELGKAGEILCALIREQKTEMARNLLQKGFPCTCVENDKNPLVEAFDLNNLEIMKLLVEAKADVNHGNPATLIWKCLYNDENYEKLVILLDSEIVDLQKRYSPSGTSMSYLVFATFCDVGSTRMMKTLLEHGCDPNETTQTSTGEISLLERALRTYSGEKVRLLIEYKADVSVIGNCSKDKLSEILE